MAEVLLFHHVQGFTPGVAALADRFRAAGHTVYAPDLFDGRTFATLPEGMGHLRELGFGTVIERGDQAAEGLPPGLVYVGLSMGVMPAQKLAQTRHGAAGALFVASCLPVEEFGTGPAGVPVQVHGKDHDEEFVDSGDLDAAKALVAEAGGELFLYPGDQHLFVDDSLADYDEPAAQRFVERALAFLAAAG